ncbi:MAG TPA: hypothetical protein VH816_12575 [Gaiellaceae bacterium]|jgi:hypothetical protein
MKRRIAFVLAGVGAVGVLGFAGFAIAGGMTVSLTDAGPAPATATVQLGDTVYFTGVGNENHAVLGPTFTIPLIHPGETVGQKMDVPGKVNYRATGFTGTHRGTIVVAVPTGLQLKASKPSVAYGAPVTLSGVSPLKSDQVVLESRSAAKGTPRTAWATVTTLPTDANDGSFSTVVKPSAATDYRVTLAAGRVLSQPVTVGVTPILTISATPRTLKTGKVLRVSGKVLPAAAATSLVLAQYDRTRNTRPWRSVAQKATTPGGTVVFTWPVVSGRTLLHLQTSKSTTRPGFLPTTSAYIVITGIGKPPTPAKKPKPAKKPRQKRPRTAS